MRLWDDEIEKRFFGTVIPPNEWERMRLWDDEIESGRAGARGLLDGLPLLDCMVEGHPTIRCQAQQVSASDSARQVETAA